MEEILVLFGVLVFFHFLADFPLQGDFLARAKNSQNPIPDIPWWIALSGHSFIHAGFVFAATGSWVCLVGEFVVHWITDDEKSKGEITFATDQAIHIGAKIVWVGFALLGVL